MGKPKPFCVCTIITAILLCGCSGFQARSTFEEANALFGRGNYQASLNKYEQIIGKYPECQPPGLFSIPVANVIFQFSDQREFLSGDDLLLRSSSFSV